MSKLPAEVVCIWNGKLSVWSFLNRQQVAKGQTRMVFQLWNCDGPTIAKLYNAAPNKAAFVAFVKETFGP